MKKVILLVIAAFIFSITAKSQDCSYYFPLSEGTEMVVKSYDKKDKVTGWTKQIIKKKETSGTNSSVTVYAETWDPKVDTATSKAEFKYECKDGVFYVDMNSYMNQQSLGAYEGMDVQATTQNMSFPKNLKVGDILDNGRVDIKVMNQGMQMFAMSVNITNRKVLAVESVTTPAGTFECTKITSDVESTMIFKVQTTVVEWYAKEIGCIKSENYDKNGKLVSYSVLETLTKP